MNKTNQPIEEIQIKNPIKIYFGFIISCLALCVLAVIALNNIGLTPNLQIWNSQKYTVLSGDSSGVYFDIANRLNKNEYIIKNTNGSDDNSHMISGNDFSFGFIQEDDLKNQNEDVVPVVDLYTEYLHIIYRKKSAKYSVCRSDKINLMASPDSCLKNLLQCSSICAGAKNSSTQFMARQILGKINGIVFSRPLIDDNLTSALEKLDSDEYQILFYTAGFTEKFNQRLKRRSEFGLASIDKSILFELGYRYGKEPITDFKSSDYPIDSRSAQTIGVKAMLVCNKKVKKDVQEKILRELDKIKEQVPALKSENFLDEFLATKKAKDSELLKWFVLLSLLFFIIYSHRAVYRISKSRYYQGFLFSFINSHIIEGLPKNYKFKNKANDIEYLKPDIHSTQIPSINNITVGISNGLVARNAINETFSRKFLLNTHYTFLMNRNDMIIKKLRKVLAHRLNYILIRDENPEKEPIFTKKLLLDYLTYEYLTQFNFDWLIKIWEKTEFYRIDKKYILQLIGKNEIYNALDSIRIVLENYKDGEKNDLINEFSNEVIHHLSRYSAIMDEKNFGISDPRDFDRTMNQIRKAVLSLVDNMVKKKILLDNESMNSLNAPNK